jgi:hypothetical protein
MYGGSVPQQRKYTTTINGLITITLTISKDAITADLRLHLCGYQTEHTDLVFTLLIK